VPGAAAAAAAACPSRPRPPARPPRPGLGRWASRGAPPGRSATVGGPAAAADGAGVTCGRGGRVRGGEEKVEYDERGEG
jgi:hypothetical protein